jgi:predicted metal-dependent peptidase
MRLMLDFPYLARAVARLPMVDVTRIGWCPTMATDGYNIFVNLNFCEALPQKDLSFVIAHEVFHCLLGHTVRRGLRQRHGWNLAVDYATNLLLAEGGMACPESALYDRAYLGLTAEEIFDRLLRENRAGTEGDESHDGWSGGFDGHIEIEDSSGSTWRQQDYPSPIVLLAIRENLLADVVSTMPGRLAGYMECEVRLTRRDERDWSRVLMRFVSGLQKTDYRMYPHNRKHLWRGIGLPSLGVPGPRELVIAVDTSASVSKAELGEFSGQIDALRTVSQCRVVVLECDAKIQKMESYEAWDGLELGMSDSRRFQGRGGTDLCAPFDWIEEHYRQTGEWPDALIYFTDGMGPHPSTAPLYEVLWIVPERGVGDFRFGEVGIVKSVVD